MERSIKISMATEPNQKWLSDFVKRLFDIVVSFLVLLFFAPLFGLIAIAIKRDSPGPVFFRGLRLGRHGKYFKILKFRTMYETAQSYSGPKVTAQDDARVTPLGHWLRDTKINEFPQFWNVLIGEMSLVGPRPEDPTLAKTWPANTAGEILSVRPGITSPASVLYRNEENMLHAKDVMQKYLQELTPDKMRLDQLYVQNRSFGLDLDVILWTALLLLPKIKEYSPPEQLLYLGPITRFIQRYLLWGILDFAVTFISIGLSSMLLRIFGPLNLDFLGAMNMAFRFSLIFVFINMVVGVNRINWTKATAWNATRLLVGWFTSVFSALIIHIYMGTATLQNVALILSTAFFSLYGFIAIRYRNSLMLGFLSRVLYSRINLQLTRERILIVGTGRTGEHIAWLLNHPAYSQIFQVVGFVENDFLSQGLKVYGARVIGFYKDVPQIIQDYNVGIILLADNRISLEDFKFFKELSSTHPTTKMLVVPDVFGALRNLVVPPPFYPPSENVNSANNSLSSYYIGRYARLEIETQIESEDLSKDD